MSFRAHRPVGGRRRDFAAFPFAFQIMRCASSPFRLRGGANRAFAEFLPPKGMLAQAPSRIFEPPSRIAGCRSRGWRRRLWPRRDLVAGWSDSQRRVSFFSYRKCACLGREWPSSVRAPHELTILSILAGDFHECHFWNCHLRRNRTLRRRLAFVRSFGCNINSGEAEKFFASRAVFLGVMRLSLIHI